MAETKNAFDLYLEAVNAGQVSPAGLALAIKTGAVTEPEAMELCERMHSAATLIPNNAAVSYFVEMEKSPTGQVRSVGAARLLTTTSTPALA